MAGATHRRNETIFGSKEHQETPKNGDKSNKRVLYAMTPRDNVENNLIELESQLKSMNKNLRIIKKGNNVAIFYNNDFLMDFKKSDLFSVNFEFTRNLDPYEKRMKEMEMDPYKKYEKRMNELMGVSEPYDPFKLGGKVVIGGLGGTIAEFGISCFRKGDHGITKNYPVKIATVIKKAGR